MLTACLWFICFLCLGWAATLVWVMALLGRCARCGKERTRRR
ncbi:hypothetical protein [Gordonibacter pamelaeae]